MPKLGDWGEKGLDSGPVLDVVFYETPSENQANGLGKVTEQLPDVISGQHLLGGEQAGLNGKHLLDIFLRLPLGGVGGPTQLKVSQ